MARESGQLAQARVVNVEDRLGMIGRALDTEVEPMDLSISATALDGMKDESSLHLEVVPDRKPVLKVVAPEENAEAIATAELHFTVEAFDDYEECGHEAFVESVSDAHDEIDSILYADFEHDMCM